RRAALATTPADDGPQLIDALAGLGVPAGQAPEGFPLLRGQRLAHRGDQHRAPRQPRWAGEDRPEQRRVLKGAPKADGRSHDGDSGGAWLRARCSASAAPGFCSALRAPSPSAFTALCATRASRTVSSSVTSLAPARRLDAASSESAESIAACSMAKHWLGES